MSDWIDGPLPGPDGMVPVIHYPREDKKPWRSLLRQPPHLCLHTTEGGTSLGDAYRRWDYPPNFAVGDGKIVQLYPLGYASEAVDTKDQYLLQVEIAYSVGQQSPTKVYLPPASSLNPLVALVAYLHKNGHITSGLKRPNPDWPVALDRLPAAVDSYYRRNDGTWPKDGVYGHVEIPDDEHYDPASFDYPEFFKMVRDVLDGEVDELAFKDYKDGMKAALQGDPLPANATADFVFGYRHEKRHTQNPAPGNHVHLEYADENHDHTVQITGKTT